MATVTNRHIAALGPVKLEALNLTACTDADTVTTLIQRPVWAIGVNNTDTETTSAAMNISISGKTLTLNNANLTGSSVVNVLVFGF
jgi:hypothetical protein